MESACSGLDEVVGLVACLEGLDVNSLGDEVLVLVQWVVGGAEPVVGWAVCLLEARILLGLLHIALDRVVEVLLRELAVVGYPVVQWCWLEVPQVLEAAHVGVAEVEWHVGVAIVDSTQLLALKEGLHVVLDDGRLDVGGMLSPCGLAVNAVAESEDVIVSLVLQGVGAHIDQAVFAGNA